MTTLKQILLDYISHANGFVTKGELYFEAQRQGYSPETGGRCARQLAEEGSIHVDYYKGKRGQKLARYARLDVPMPTKQKVEIIEKDGQRIAVLV